jgi:hypothetical protein
MGSPSLTKRLQKAARKGQEIVNHHGVPVDHKARNDADPRPWLTAAGHAPQTRHSASECMARLILPLPAGAVLEHTQSRKRVLFVGPSPQGYPWLVQVDVDGQTMEISRNLLRPVKS